MVNSLLALAAEATHAIGSASGDAGSTDVRSVYKRILEKETLGEVRELFISLFHNRSQVDSQGASDSSKRQLLVGTIKHIVEARYTDPSLCLQSVADMVNLSPSYVGKQFRDEEELSVAKYITSVRMKHAADLLGQTDSSVNAIMEKVGFVNQSYFFKLFKQHFGLTPNEYKTDYSGKNG
jgi:YesN/AraC family two-component response regulator